MAKLPPKYRATIEIEYRTDHREVAGDFLNAQLKHVMRELIDDPAFTDPGIAATLSERIT